MIRKLRAGMMPPPGARRPDAETRSRRSPVALETDVDTAAALHPNPGRRTFQRLNRAEYARSVRELLDLDVDVNAFLPPDTMSAGFDNIADVQSVSPTLLEGYLRAASKISSLALGDRNASPSETTFKVPRTQSQMQHIEGTPWGTRGGISVRAHVSGRRRIHVPRDAARHAGRVSCSAACSSRDEQIEISINGERVALHRHRLRHQREGQERPEPHHAADSRQGGPAAHGGRVHPEVRRRRSTIWSRRSTTRSPTPSTATASASPRCRTCATSASPARSR